MNDELEVLRSQKRTLEMSNKLMDAEICKLRAEIGFLNGVIDNRCAEITRLKNRGFWRRVFNM